MEPELVINAKGAVAVFLAPLESRPRACGLSGDMVVLRMDASSRSLAAPCQFIRCLQRQGSLLVVECSGPQIYRETHVVLEEGLK